MWIFEEDVAEKRKEYNFLVKLLHVDGFTGAGQRNGKIVRTQEPEQYPLSRALPVTVEIEFSDNHGNTCRQRVPVRDLVTQDCPPNGCMMIITKGARQGMVRKHKKTIGKTVKLKVENEKIYSTCNERSMPFRIN